MVYKTGMHFSGVVRDSSYSSGLVNYTFQYAGGTMALIFRFFFFFKFTKHIEG